VRLRVYYETSMGDAAAEQDFRQRLSAANAARGGTAAAASAGDGAAG